MRPTPSQAITISLPATMLEQLDAMAERLGATRSELIRAAFRCYVHQREKDDALLARVREQFVDETEEDLAARALAARRARNSRKSA